LSARSSASSHTYGRPQLYTKAYELFKKYAPANAQNQNQGRLTLWIAYRIGQTYYDSGKFDMAVRYIIMLVFTVS
jgi:hypothetical protein